MYKQQTNWEFMLETTTIMGGLLVAGVCVIVAGGFGINAYAEHRREKARAARMPAYLQVWHRVEAEWAGGADLAVVKSGSGGTSFSGAPGAVAARWQPVLAQIRHEFKHYSC